jgi:hypothetical protein
MMSLGHVYDAFRMARYFCKTKICAKVKIEFLLITIIYIYGLFLITYAQPMNIHVGTDK